MDFKTNISLILKIVNLFPKELLYMDARHQKCCISFRKPFDYAIMALSRILYGCGLIHVCVKTYVIKLHKRVRGKGESAYSWKLG